MSKTAKYQASPIIVNDVIQPAVKLSIYKGSLHIECLLHERTRIHGFGRFLEKYDPNEVQITSEAKAILLKTPERRGLMRAEFFAGNIIAWGDPAYKILVDFKDVSVAKEAKDQIKKFVVVKE